MYDNNITGDVNVLYSLSNSNGGILSSFVVDTDEVICRGCTDSDDVVNDNGFGNGSTKMDPYESKQPLDCNFTNTKKLHVLTQCHC
jgi:hypothetical protein